MAKVGKTQQFEQFFWDTIGTDTKVEDVQKLIVMIESSPWFTKLVDLLGNIRGKKVLDCGCGIGNLGVYLAMRGAYIEGFDISSEMLKVARANAEKNGIARECNFLCFGFEDLPYRDISFDLAVGELIFFITLT